MKAFLLAAGKGTRLKPLTDSRPKCLVPIHGEPLLAIWIDLLGRHDVTDVLINTHHHADQVDRFLSDYQTRSAVTLHWVHEPQLLGSAGTLWRNRDFVNGESDFLIAYADTLTNLNLLKMFDFHRTFRSMGGILTMGLIRAPDPTQCGIVTMDDTHRIVRFVEKPRRPDSDLANGGIYCAAQTLFDFCTHRAAPRDLVLDLGHHILPMLVGRMYGYPITEYLRDIGNPEAYRQALAEWPRLAKE